ncbi:MAG TPA: hypothetical protein VEB20_20935 [Azospirillaceae bacterium]|nr:hypothetical protein [Azospirillaceae bacterium]
MSDQSPVTAPAADEAVKQQAAAMMQELGAVQSQLAAAAATLEGIRAFGQRMEAACNPDGTVDLEALERLRDELLASLGK